MTTLRRKVLVLASALMVTLALVVLPSCARKTTPTTTKTGAKTSKMDKILKGME
jgi:hypothetical protein